MKILKTIPENEEFILLLDKGKFQEIHDDLTDVQLKKTLSRILEELPF